MSSGALAAKGSDGNLVAGSQKGTNVQVAVRCRPLNNEEKKGNQSTIIACDTATKAVNVSYGPPGKKTNKTYNFDRVFGMYSTQEEVFDGIVRPIVEELLAGFNCTIFAYGQTGTLFHLCQNFGHCFDSFLSHNMVKRSFFFSTFF